MMEIEKHKWQVNLESEYLMTNKILTYCQRWNDSPSIDAKGKKSNFAVEKLSKYDLNQRIMVDMTNIGTNPHDRPFDVMHQEVRTSHLGYSCQKVIV